MIGHRLRTRLLAEFIGSAMLLIAVVGSGIAAVRLSPSDTGLQLFEAAVATGFGLTAIILALQPVSGAHINPAVTVVDRVLGDLPTGDALRYVAVQLAGATAGTVIANLMFELPAIEIATTSRAGAGTFLGEVVATVGLLLIIFAMVRSGREQFVAFGVGSFIGGAYFFTSSTAFANPAVTVARIFTDTFAGITPGSAMMFLAAEVVGLGVALVVIAGLFPRNEAGVDPASTSAPNPTSTARRSPNGIQIHE